MSNLPMNWVEAKLEQLCDFNPRHDLSINRKQAVSFVPMPAVSDSEGVILPHSTRSVEEIWKGYTHFQNDDVIFAKITPCMENGKIAIATDLYNGLACGSTEFHVLRLSRAILPKYLWYFIRQVDFRREAEQHMTGAVGQQRVPVQFLKETRIPLPPLNEQRRIVAKLDSLFARSRAARQELEHIPQLIRRCKQAVLEAAFRGDLTANWRQLRGDKKNFIPQTSKVLPREFDGIFIPEDWNFYSVEELTENHDGKRIPVKSSDRAIRQGNYPYYGASGAIDTIDDYIFDGEYLLIGEDGANLIARSTPIAFQVTGKFWVNNHAHVVKVRKNILIGFLSYYINSINLEPYVSGSAQPKLTQRNLNSIIVPLPSIEEQQEIVNRIEKLFKSVEVIEQNYQKAVKLLERLEQAILAKAFRGELVPQDPKDEPASVLLERIQAQRQEKPKRQSRRLKK